MKRGDLIEVMWLDSCDNGKDGWFNSEEFENDTTLAEIQTVGIFYGQDKRMIKIVGSRSVNPDIVTLVREEIKIPKGCILSIGKLGRVK